MFSLNGLQPQLASVLSQLSAAVNSARSVGQNVAGRGACAQKRPSVSMHSTSTERVNENSNAENVLPGLEGLGLRDLLVATRDLQVEDLCRVTQQISLVKKSPHLMSQWLSQYSSADTFFENKHGFSEQNLLSPSQRHLPVEHPLLLKPKYLPRLFYQQQCGFRTKASRTKSVEDIDGTTFRSISKFLEQYQDQGWKSKKNLKIKSMIDDPKSSPEMVKNMKVAFAEGVLANMQDEPVKRSTVSRALKSILLTAIGVGLTLSLLVVLIGRSNKAFQQVMNQRKDYEVSPEEITVTFDDVKGADEAKQELQEVVQFLMDPDRFRYLGAKLPKGVLLVGPPGTGKTLLARAVAGEAGVPFFFASGSEFDEVFVGTGANRVRNLFSAAKARAPCVIFIDEIDTVGAKRTSSHMHPYANQTINQLLSEMDGFQQSENIIVLGATNRRDNLDRALLRPGRFDVEVQVSAPDLKGRKDILNLYLKKIVTDKGVNVDKLARGTVGFTGAELQNMVNMAAIKASQDKCRAVNMTHMEFARDKVLMGPEKITKIMDEETNWITAYHEAGHTLMAYFTQDATKLHKVTIMPRGMSMGHTSFVPEKEVYNQTKSQLLAELDVAMGGRVAEEIMYGQDKVTTGASSDFQKATAIATAMVKKFGMSEKVGVRVIEDSEMDSLGLPRQTGLSPATTDLIDSEIKRLLQESYERSKTLLKTHSSEHKALAKALMVHKTLDFEEIKHIVEGNSVESLTTKLKSKPELMQ